MVRKPWNGQVLRLFGYHLPAVEPIEKGSSASARAWMPVFVSVRYRTCLTPAWLVIARRDFSDSRLEHGAADHT